ncbi:TBC1 domain family member 15-like isoform X3 [Corticium candelabrum]|nr:TBC1 domain family member 15-like isoform X3 [Corticium candelabrum]
MEDIGKAERAQTQERMESERDASQCDATNEEIAAHATEEDENSVCREYEQGTPLDRETWAGFSDQDGRIINELKLRKCVFRGGIDESIRPEVWSFLFGLYPLSSTYREREVISADYHVRYRALKRRWQTMLHLVTSSEAVPSLPDYMSDEANFEEISDKTEESGNQRASTSCSIDSIDSSERDDSVVAHIDVDSGEKFEQFSFAELQAQVYATRQPVDFKNLHKAIKLIDKDVPRTDRDQPLFRSRQNLKVLRDVLITYATFHPEVSYVQGMNDIAGRFLYVFKSEVETYWSLDRYIDKIKGDFLQETMLAKMALIGKLLEEMDPELCSFLQSVDLGHLVFCHRWLILCFKREFKYNESLQLFEILSSCHLELTSLEAEQARAETRIEQVLKEEGQRNEKADQVEIHQEYTFDLFVCVAILKEHREDLMACADQNLVFQYISSFAMKLDVDTVLEKSQELFFLYCKKSVMDCFQQDSCVDGSSTKT